MQIRRRPIDRSRSATRFIACSSLAHLALLAGCGGARSAVDVAPIRPSVFAPLLASAPDDVFAIVGADLHALRAHPTSATYLDSVRIRLDPSSRRSLDATSRVALVYAPGSPNADSVADGAIGAPLSEEEARLADQLEAAFEPAPDPERSQVFDALDGALDVEPSWTNWSTAIVIESAACAELGHAEIAAIRGARPGQMRFRVVGEGLCAFGDAELVDRFEPRPALAPAARAFVHAESTATIAPVLLALLDRGGAEDPLAYRDPGPSADADPDDLSYDRHRAREELHRAYELMGNLRDVVGITACGGFADDERFGLDVELRLVDDSAAEAVAASLRRRFENLRAELRAERRFDERHPDVGGPVSEDGGFPARIPSLRTLAQAFHDPAIERVDARVRLAFVDDREETVERLAPVRAEIERTLAAEEGRDGEATDDARRQAEAARAERRARARIMNGIQFMSAWPTDRRLALLDEVGPAIDALLGSGATDLLRARTFVDAGDFAAAEALVTSSIASGDSARARLFVGVRAEIAWERGDRAALDAIVTDPVAASAFDSTRRFVARTRALDGEFESAIRSLGSGPASVFEENAFIELELMRGRYDVAAALVDAVARSDAFDPARENALPMPCSFHLAKAIAAVRRGDRPDVSAGVANCRSIRPRDLDPDYWAETDVDVCELLAVGDPADPATRTRCSDTLSEAIRVRHPTHPEIVRLLIAIARLPNADRDARARARAAIEFFPAGSPIRRYFEWTSAGYPPIRPSRARR